MVIEEWSDFYDHFWWNV